MATLTGGQILIRYMDAVHPVIATQLRKAVVFQLIHHALQNDIVQLPSWHYFYDAQKQKFILKEHIKLACIRCLPYIGACVCKCCQGGGLHCMFEWWLAFKGRPTPPCTQPGAALSCPVLSCPCGGKQTKRDERGKK